MKTAWSKSTQSKTVLPLATLLFGLCITVASGLWSRHPIDYNEKTALDLTVQRVSNNIVDLFFKANYGLAGTIGLYAASDRVIRPIFRRSGCICNRCMKINMRCHDVTDIKVL